MIEHLNKDGFVWWQGVVKSRKDPLKIGRCQVRILGYHDDEKNIPDNDLPWAYPAMPINVRPNSVATGLVEGVWVLGFFRDGHDAQEPVITHLINYGKARNDDPYKPKEKTIHTENFVEGEINTNRLAQGDKTGTIIDQHDADLPPGYPPSPYKAEFPYNYVEESESGHVIEIDDTSGAERLSISHRTGSFVEIHPDGTQVSKVVGVRYTVILRSDNITIEGDVDNKINGQRREEIAGDLDMFMDNKKEEIKGDFKIDIGGDEDKNVDGSYEFKAKSIDIKSTTGTKIDESSAVEIKGSIINLNPL